MGTDYGIPGGVPTRFVIRCEACGHQAVATVIVVGRREPRFVCSACGDKEPDVERWVRR